MLIVQAEDSACPWGRRPAKHSADQKKKSTYNKFWCLDDHATVACCISSLYLLVVPIPCVSPLFYVLLVLLYCAMHSSQERAADLKYDRWDKKVTAARATLTEAQQALNRCTPHS